MGLNVLTVNGIKICLDVREELLAWVEREFITARRPISIYPLTFSGLLKSYFSNRQKRGLKGFSITVPATFLAAFAVRFLSRRTVRAIPFSGLMIDIIELINHNEMISFIIGADTALLKLFIKNIRRISPDIVLKGVIPARTANFKYHDTLTLLKKTCPDLLIIDEELLFIPKLMKLYRGKSDMPRLSFFCGDSLKIYAGSRKNPQERFQNAFLEGIFRLLKRPWHIYRLPYYAIFFLRLFSLRLFDKFKVHEL